VINVSQTKVRIATVVGLPGVGKSTVLSIAVKELEKRGYHVELVNFGDFMFEAMKRAGLVSSRDEIRRYRFREQKRYQIQAAKDIVKHFSEVASKSDKPVIGLVDTHAVIKTVAGFWPGLPKYVIEELNPDVIIVIEATPEEIVSRASKDRTRYRADYLDINLIRELLNLNRVYAISSATHVGASVVFVENREGKPEEAAKKVVEVLMNI